MVRINKVKVIVRYLLAFAVFSSLMLGYSCIPRFKHPIPPPEDLKPDQSILGLWFRKTPNDKQQLSIFPRTDGWVDIVYVYDIDSKMSADGINVLVFEGYSVSVEKHNFLCFRIRKKGRPIPSNNRSDTRAFLIINYSVSKEGNLSVRQMSADKIADLITSGRLRGQTAKAEMNINKDGFEFNDGSAVASSGDELVNVMRQEGVAAFLGDPESDKMIFLRRQWEEKLGKL